VGEPVAGLAERYAAAADFASYVAVARKNVELWNGLYRTVRIDEEFLARTRALRGTWHLLALSEDWCGDAANALPLLQRLVEECPRLDLRILARDRNLDLMDAHLTGRSRSIPVVMALDENLEEHGWWGPRPSPLQRWVLSEGLALPKDERYKRQREWYARDRGRTTLDEVLGMLERGEGRGVRGEEVRDEGRAPSAIKDRGEGRAPSAE